MSPSSPSKAVLKKSNWKGSLTLGFEPRAEKTALVKRLHKGPLTVQRAFYPENGVCHVYVLHPPGGVVGGDELQITAMLDAHSEALITTPGATKFYRSANDTAIQSQTLIVEDNATLEWLPQENIFFPGAKVKSSLHVELKGRAKVAFWDIQCFGRPSNNEAFEHGSVDSHLRLFRDSKPLLLERLRIDENNRTSLSQLQHHPVSATFVLSDASKIDVSELTHSKIISEHEYLATTLIDDVMVVRYLGNSTENARNYFIHLWQQIRQAALGHAPIIPRIWNT